MPEDFSNSEMNEDPVPFKREPRLAEIFPGIHLSSFEEQAELTRNYSASLSPVERMAHLHKLILIAYAQELQRPIEELWNNNIVMDEFKW
ncbi:MAG TPA: hypothetical protein VI731_02780 [Bacteroidia bacterium]|nr:hypothetical protein [Bacteroidia bacterium]